MGPPHLSSLPFKDEDIGEAEEEARWNTWREIEKAYEVTMEVPLWQRISAWLNKDKLTPTEEYAVNMYRALEARIKKMEQEDATGSEG
jgi:hypothetical protein